MVLATYRPDHVSALKVLDPCCGTGGFLVSYVNTIRGVLRDLEKAKTGRSDVEQAVSNRIRDICTRNLFGIDINPFLVRTCQMNLVMHGDGSVNVFQADSLLSPAEWHGSEAPRRIPYGKADIVLTNPPFGGSGIVDDPHLLDKYQLARFEISSVRSSLPAEQLFVEGALRYLKPGGRLGIVLPTVS
jgi:type I restriction enzyme M protein